MKDFFKHLYDCFLSLFKSFDKYYLMLTLLPLVVALLLNGLLGILGGVILILAMGIAIILCHYFVPTKESEICGIKFNIPDFEVFKKSLGLYLFEVENSPDLNDIYYVYLSCVMFVLLKLLFMIF